MDDAIENAPKENQEENLDVKRNGLMTTIDNVKENLVELVDIGTNENTKLLENDLIPKNSTCKPVYRKEIDEELSTNAALISEGENLVETRNYMIWNTSSKKANGTEQEAKYESERLLKSHVNTESK